MTTTPPTMPSVQAFLTTQDVQQLIRVDKSTIYRMAESGRIPAIKVGRQWRFPAVFWVHSFSRSPRRDDPMPSRRQSANDGQPKS